MDSIPLTKMPALLVDLMQIRTDAHQGSARGRRGKEAGINAVPATLEPCGAIGVGQKIAPVECIHINGERWGL